MIAQSVISEIKRLLAEPKRLTHLKIAERVGVSRGTVSGIANKKRKEVAREQVPIVYLGGPIKRCSRCGVKVKTPCLACLLEVERKYKRLQRLEQRSKK